MRIVRIKWTDSASYHGWSPGNLMKPSIIQTIGILSEDNADHICIFQSASSIGNFSGLLAIPKGCVIEVEVLGDVSVPDIESD